MQLLFCFGFNFEKQFDNKVDYNNILKYSTDVKWLTIH